MIKPKRSANVKILFFGHEIGGQMQLLAEKFRKRWIKATAAACNEDFRGYQNDINISRNTMRQKLSKMLFSFWALIHYDVFHFFWGVSLWGFWRFHLLDLPILKLLGKTIVVHFRGLDVIDIGYFDYKRNIAKGKKVTKPLRSRADQKRKIKKWCRYADRILVSEPDLHFVDDSSILSPQVIDLEYWRCLGQTRNIKDETIRIVHAPSSRRKKGTDFVASAVAELKRYGYDVELILAENLGHHKVKELYCISDIGVDQVLYGWHGKAAIEMMAVGLPVVCNIQEEYRKYRPDLPIFEATPKNLVSRLRVLIEDRPLREELSKKSIEYVSRNHDVEVVLDQLADIYGLDAKTARQEKILNVKTW